MELPITGSSGDGEGDRRYFSNTDLQIDCVVPIMGCVWVLLGTQILHHRSTANQIEPLFNRAITSQSV